MTKLWMPVCPISPPSMHAQMTKILVTGLSLDFLKPKIVQGDEMRLFTDKGIPPIFIFVMWQA